MTKRLEMGAYEKLKKVVLNRDGWKCRYCKIRNGLSCHHIIYRSQGGEDTAENIAALCHLCHAAVHSMQLLLLPNSGELVDANQKITFKALDGWRPKR